MLVSIILLMDTILMHEIDTITDLWSIICYSVFIVKRILVCENATKRITVEQFTKRLGV